MAERCEACELRIADRVEASDDPERPYHVCSTCLRRLQTRALRPLEWYNLAKRHGWHEFLLHDDFYDEQGRALQPEEEVESPELFPAPTLRDVALDAYLLLDYSITRWRMQPELVKAWAVLEAPKALAALSGRFACERNTAIRSRILEVCALALQQSAGDFVRYAWGEYPQGVSLPSLAQASAACLSFREGFDRVAAALEIELSANKRDLILCLGYFQSSEGLDW